MEKLTTAQQQLVEENMKLVPFVLHKHNFYASGIHDWDDLMSIGYVGLCRAAKKYTPHKGTFSNWAVICIRSELRGFLQAEARPMRNPGEAPITLEGRIVPDKCSVENEVIFRDALNRALARCNPKTRDMTERWLEGATLTQIGQQLGCTRSWVGQKIKRFKQIFSAELRGVYDTEATKDD